MDRGVPKEPLKASELRIGNWVFWNYNGGCVAAPILHLEKGEELDVYPIPITPEILEKAGFGIEECADGLFGVFPHDSDYQIWPNGEVTMYADGADYYISKCEYLHQLQNLYFALTGEELNIEL